MSSYSKPSAWSGRSRIAVSFELVIIFLHWSKGNYPLSPLFSFEAVFVWWFVQIDKSLQTFTLLTPLDVCSPAPFHICSLPLISCRLHCWLRSPGGEYFWVWWCFDGVKLLRGLRRWHLLGVWILVWRISKVKDKVVVSMLETMPHELVTWYLFQGNSGRVWFWSCWVILRSGVWFSLYSLVPVGLDQIGVRSGCVRSAHLPTHQPSARARSHTLPMLWFLRGLI